jgi:hypothetical protein
MRDHTRNLQTIEDNLERAQAHALANPTDWNVSRAFALVQAKNDYHRFMAGEIKRHQMCHTAIELTMDMPSWGTYGT